MSSAGTIRSSPDAASTSIALRLRLAFGAVAATTLIASVAAIWAFSLVNTTFKTVSSHSFPATVAASHLRVNSQELSTTLAALAGAATPEARHAAENYLQNILETLPGQIAGLGEGHAEAESQLARVVDAFRKNIAETDLLVGERLALEQRKQELLNQTGDRQRRFLAAIDPIVTAANADLLAAARRVSVTSAAAVHGLIDKEFATLQALLQARAGAFRLAAESAGSGTAAQPLHRMVDDIERTLDVIDGKARDDGRKVIAAAKPLPAGGIPDAARVATIAKAVSAFDATLTPLIQHSTIQLVAKSDILTTEATNAVVLLVAEQAASVSAALRVQGDANLLVSLIGQAVNATSAGELDEIDRIFRNTVLSMQKARKELRIDSNLGEVDRTLASLRSLAEARDGVFAVRRRQLALFAISQNLLESNRIVTERLVGAVQKITDDIGHELDSEIVVVERRLQGSTWILAALAIFSLAFSAALGSLYVGRRIARRLTDLSDSMRAIAGGNLDVSIPNAGNDEISTMGRSLQVFRGAMEEVDKRTAEAEAARKRLVDMTDRLPLTVVQYRISSDGKSGYVFIGKGVHEVLGVDVLEILSDQNAGWRNVVDEDRAVTKPLLRRALNERLPIEFHLRVRIDGRIRWIYTHCVPSKLPDNSWVWNGFWMDVTPSREQAEELRVAKEAAEEATLAKSLFLANMSHEIRTPMNAIIGLSHLALKTELNIKQHDYVAKIHNAGTSLLGIINDILDFSKIEAGKIDIQAATFMLDRTMDNVMTMVGHKVADKGLELIFDVPPTVPQSLVGDSLRLEQILTNLIGNAVKFTERGEVLVGVEWLDSTGTRDKLKFSVRDTGIGMTSDQQQRLFQAFTQADGSITRKYGGTGLGLTISKRLVEMMGGAIWVESESGVGSTFCFTAWFGRGQSATPRELPSQITGLRVLIVDDNPDARRVLAGHCAVLPLEVDEAASGREALAAVRQADQENRSYGLVLMDWAMPNLDGLETARAIKFDAALAILPAVVMVTAFGRDDVKEQVDNVPLDGFLVKPVSASTLVDTLAELYGRDAGAVPVSVVRNYRLDGLRVLLVEDNAVNQQIAMELLMSAGIVVDAADNGRIALDKLASGRRYDIVLMDLQMPEMDGFAAARLIRADTSLQAMPIVAMTAHAMAEERQHCVDAGMNDHISKPIDPDMLFATLARWSGRSHEGKDAVAPGIRTITAMSADCLDSVTALRRVAGNADLYHTLLARFVTDYADVPERIMVLLAEGDRATAERIAHTTRGVAGNLGADALAGKAGELEHAIRNGQEDAALLAAVADSCAATVAAIRRMVQDVDALCAAEAHTQGGTAPPAAAPHETLQRLTDYLASGSADAIDYFIEHRGGLLTFLGEHAAPTERAINDFDFEIALELVHTAAQAQDVELDR